MKRVFLVVSLAALAAFAKAESARPFDIVTVKPALVRTSPDGGTPKPLPHVTVGGAVLRPQKVPWIAGMTVLSAISAAGGASRYAQGEVTLYRDTKPTRLSIRQIKSNKWLDLELKPWDQIDIQ